MANINEDEYFEEDDDLWEDDERVYNSEPSTDYQRIELLRLALNFPKRPGEAPVYECCTPTDLEELESILKKHFRP